MNTAALEWARARVRGPSRADAAGAAPEGMTRIVDGDHAWYLPGWPDGATPALLEEYETTPLAPEKAGQTRRVLAAVLRCCWPDLGAAPWPGTTAEVATVLAVFTSMSRGDTEISGEVELAGRWALGDLRRLDATHWVLLDEAAGTVRLGPRVAMWHEDSLGPLRDLLRGMPPGEPT